MANVRQSAPRRQTDPPEITHPNIGGDDGIDDWDITTGVGITALAVAAARAVERHQPDAMCDDPWAAAFVQAADLHEPMPTTPEEVTANALPDTWILTHRYLGIRTKFLDAVVARAVADGIRQTVILAAGLDTRAFRLPWPAGSTVYEIDQPRVLSFKLAVLRAQGATAGCTHRLVPVDLRRDWATSLLATGFDPDTPTLWLVEGLTPYLPAQAELRLLAGIDAHSAPGSRIAVEEARKILSAVSDEELDGARQRWGVDMRTLVYDEDDRDAAGVLRGLGWRVTAETIASISRRYGHPVDAAFAVTADASQLVAAERPGPAAPTPPR
ncbi:SAM-dependent methyltransferase [Frankia sp. R82]|uniref:SAM-dependent methyltransferase n=1 Tax=Frankia sp. R82 TaxID=2950553 RepID=UPI0020430B15|nr:SAM-dependent methyltransferase [Frankia sp. R82]MCM3885654.1 SAM-dependent methyltransferase [Frankia sp. R82]